MQSICTKVNDWITYIGVNDRLKPLFENQWPLPGGVSYNAYLITDEKTTLMDCVDMHESERFLSNLQSALGERTLDYYVIHHVEPDHSSTIPLIKSLYPNVTLVGNKKTFEFLENFYGLKQDHRLVVGDGDTLSLGQHELTFTLTAMTHWPESMVSFEPHDGVLFSQDIFGGFGTLDGTIFDDEIGDLQPVYDEACRYYTNIVGKYSKMALRNIQKLAGLDIKMILPVHGPVWRSYPEKILKLYTNLAQQQSQNGVVIAFGSMYGNTEKMADLLGRFLAEEGVKNVQIMDITKTHASLISTEIWKYRGVILGAPTYNNALFLPMKHLVEILSENKMANKTLGIFGNYSWSGGAVRELKAWAETQPFELLEPVVEVRSAAKGEDIEALRALAKAMAENLASHAETDNVKYYAV
ncbi:MAG: FprA family A-type flavoprotein [Peptoniphilaceae bacterium]|nr:FprA family A-type flavoprotein [Peptoniphilaceae bacterium]